MPLEEYSRHGLTEYPGMRLKKALEEDKEVIALSTGQLPATSWTKVAPETANTARELAWQMIKPSASHQKALASAVGNVLYNPYQGLMLKKPTNSKPYILLIQIMQ